MDLSVVNQSAPPQAKIALFRSLFRGREDVYARRFESRKTGKAGYALACANEWVRGICEKPRIKCAECPHRRFLPVTDDVIRWHLSGRDDAGQPFVAGVYPLLQDETCFFVAVDFDKGGWREDAAAYLDACRRLSLPAALERSRSGGGAHVWLFFDEAIPAALARRLGSHILTETMEGRPEVGLDSYDRLFPNQDTLPQGGFGNLIALPMQKGPRGQGNSLFLDDQLEPYADQWEFLAGVRKISRSQVERIVQDAERRGRILGVRLPPQEDGDEEPWTAPASRRRRDPPIVGELPRTLELVLGGQIYIAKEGLSPALRNRLLRLAAFQNPEFYRAQVMRLPTYGKPRVIACAEDHAHHIGLPRGCLDEVRQALGDVGTRATVRDERFRGRSLDVTFHGELRTEQRAAADAMLAHDTGVLAATTAFGKTVIAAWLIAQRGVNTLVLVHRQQLLDQWVERLSAFLGIPPKSIGRTGGGRNRPTGQLDVALIQSLVRKGVVDDRMADYGHVIVDECHHVSAHSFEQVTRQAKARFVVGLSATVARKDGHQPLRAEVDRVVGQYATRGGYLYESRIKTLDSYLAKLQSGRFSSLDLDDLFAATIVVHRTEQIGACVDNLPTSVHVEERRDPSSRRQEPEAFGFNDTIAICRLAAPAGADVKPGAIYDVHFEIQVKTILQFAWAKLTHAVAYKANEVNWRRHRLAAQMRAATEQADLLYATFDALVQNVPAGRSDRMDEREEIFRQITDMSARGLVPEEQKPTDMVHFSDSCIALCQIAGVGVNVGLNELEGYLRGAGYPVALTLIEVLSGVLLTKRWGQLPLRKIRGRRFFFFVTDEAVDIFPKLGEIPRDLRLGA